MTSAYLTTLYDVPNPLLSGVMVALCRAARAVRLASAADGVTIRQNNHPPGQHTPHVHFHLVPRFHGDRHDGYVPDSLTPLRARERAWQARRLADEMATIDGEDYTHSPPPARDCVGCGFDGRWPSGQPVATATSWWCRPHANGPEITVEMWVGLREHVTELSRLPSMLAVRLLRRARDCAVAAQRAFGADGTTIRLHDGPLGQDVPHVGFHVVPRYLGDTFLRTQPVELALPDRVVQARRFAEVWPGCRC